MDLNDAVDLESRVYAQVFGRLPVLITRGSGVYLYGPDGRRYLDFFAGIGVCSVGHCHPEVVSAIKNQAETLMHTSNWVYTQPQLELAEKLAGLAGMEKVFLSNDGTESVECAIKLARKVTGKKEVVAMENAFHGRTMGALSLTWGSKYRKPFEPLVPEMKFVEYNNIPALKKTLTKDTAAVIVEPIQSEAGVLVPDEGYLKAVREVTEEKDVLLIVDEVATGFGRTGRMFAFQHEKIKPDILCLAKALGGGFPVGATLYSGFDFGGGEHGGTTGGNPLACSAALASVNVIDKEKLYENSRKMGEYLIKNLGERDLSVRGRGLMVGFGVESGREAVLKLVEKNVLAIYSNDTVRLLPPLVVDKGHVKQFLSAVEELNIR